MTISNAIGENPYTGNGSTAVYGFTFSVNAATEVVVVEADTAGTTRTLTYGTEYSVTGVNVPTGGTVTRIAGVLPTGYKWVIKSTIPLLQDTSIKNQSGFFPDVVERAFDRVVRMIQQVSNKVGRQITVPDTDPAIGPLPSAALRANKPFYFDAAGNPTVSGAASNSIPDFGLVQVIDTIALLKALAVPSSAITYFVRGYYAAGDGGGGRFRWNSADGSADNGGTIIQLAAGGLGRWNLIYDSALNVRWFGAKGDGATNDTTAFQSALTVAGSIKGAVYVPPGQYVLTSQLTLPLGTSLFGSGKSWFTDSLTYLCGSVLLKNHNSNCISLTGSGGNNDIGGSIENISIIGSVGNTGGSAVYIDGVQQTVLRNISATRMGGNSFTFGATNTVNFTTYVTASNVYANSVSAGKAAFYCNGKWFRLYDCISDGGQDGLYAVSLGQSFIYGFHAETFTRYGIFLSGSSQNKIESVYLGIGSAATVAAIYLDNVSGTYFNQFNKVHIAAGLVVAGQRGVWCTGSNCVQNRFFDLRVELTDSGYTDTSGNGNELASSLFYGCTAPITIAADGSYVHHNNIQATAGTFSIIHSGGTIGIWSDNNLDKIINPAVTGVHGNFNGVRVTNNLGYITRKTGVSGSIATGTAVSHGLAGSPELVVLSTNTGGSWAQLNWSTITATQFTINFNGGGNIQANWIANCPCDKW